MNITTIKYDSFMPINHFFFIYFTDSFAHNLWQMCGLSIYISFSFPHLASYALFRKMSRLITFWLENNWRSTVHWTQGGRHSPNWYEWLQLHRCQFASGELQLTSAWVLCHMCAISMRVPGKRRVRDQFGECRPSWLHNFDSNNTTDRIVREFIKQFRK